jgi:ribonuclease HI
MNGRFRRKTNLPWWERLDRASAPHKVRWEWTRGHVGHLLQEAADKAARSIAAAGHVDPLILRDAVDKVGTADDTATD